MCLLPGVGIEACAEKSIIKNGGCAPCFKLLDLPVPEEITNMAPRILKKQSKPAPKAAVVARKRKSAKAVEEVVQAATRMLALENIDITLTRISGHLADVAKHLESLATKGLRYEQVRVQVEGAATVAAAAARSLESKAMEAGKKAHAALEKPVDAPRCSDCGAALTSENAAGLKTGSPKHIDCPKAAKEEPEELEVEDDGPVEEKVTSDAVRSASLAFIKKHGKDKWASLTRQVGATDAKISLIPEGQLARFMALMVKADA